MFLFSLTSLSAVAEFGVTYDFSGGRFGDCLLSYLHAKWIAYERHIPLVYKPFVHSSKLVLDAKELSSFNLGTEPRMRVYWGFPSNPRMTLPLFYICPYFPESQWELENTKAIGGNPWMYFKVDWKDPDFRKIAREMISPKTELPLIVPPKDRISIAIHLREGGDYDFSDKYTAWPLKFPPLDFYIESLRAAIEKLPGKPIYCFVFTDAIDRESWVDKIKEAIPPDVPILFDYRKKDNKPAAHVLEDFFSLYNFDILIRPESNFSLVPSLLHDYALLYYPDAFSRVGDTNAVTHIHAEINEELYQRLLQ